DLLVTAHARAAVTGELDEVDRVEDRDRAREVSPKNEARLERAHEHRLVAGVVAADLRAHRPHPLGKLRRGEVNLPEAVIREGGVSWRYRGGNAGPGARGRAGRRA